MFSSEDVRGKEADKEADRACGKENETKENQSDLVYGAQNRLFTHLRKKGLVIPESIQASAFCGAFEATMHQSFKDDLDTAKLSPNFASTSPGGLETTLNLCARP